jgi:hypothetical protein
MRVLRAAGAALILTALSTASSAAQNQLANPGFESGDLFGWAVSTTGSSTVQAGSAGTPISGVPFFGSGSSLVRSGSYSAFGTVASIAFPPGTLLFSQVLSLTPGTTYDIGFYAANSSTTLTAFGIAIGPVNNGMQLFADGVQLLPNVYNQVNALTGDWIPIQASFTATAPTTTVAFRITGSGSAYAPLSMDDFFVTAQTVTPEPASLLLMATGLGVVLVGAKRRTQS